VPGCCGSRYEGTAPLGRVWCLLPCPGPIWCFVEGVDRRVWDTRDSSQVPCIATGRWQASMGLRAADIADAGKDARRSAIDGG
jgi:hypothetical protein